MAENTGTANLPRECWDAWDPMLIAEGLFGAANIFRWNGPRFFQGGPSEEIET